MVILTHVVREIDRVFKKINEGLDIFNTYHERHENSTNPSQRDKLESVSITNWK